MFLLAKCVVWWPLSFKFNHLSHWSLWFKRTSNMSLLETFARGIFASLPFLPKVEILKDPELLRTRKVICWEGMNWSSNKYERLNYSCRWIYFLWFIEGSEVKVTRRCSIFISIWFAYLISGQTSSRRQLPISFLSSLFSMKEKLMQTTLQIPLLTFDLLHFSSFVVVCMFYRMMNVRYANQVNDLFFKVRSTVILP